MNGPATTISPALTINSKHLCELIKACSEAKVSEFKLGDLHITFNGAKSPNNLTDVANNPNNGLRSVPLEPVNDRDQELENLMITDPAAYEEMVSVTE